MEPRKRTRAAPVPALAAPEPAASAWRRRGTEQPHRRVGTPAGRSVVPARLLMPEATGPANGREGTALRARSRAAPEQEAKTATAANQKEASRTRSGALRAPRAAQEEVATKSASRAGLAQVPLATQAASPKHTAAHEAPGAASCQRDALPCTQGGRLLRFCSCVSPSMPSGIPERELLL